MNCFSAFPRLPFHRRVDKSSVERSNEDTKLNNSSRMEPAPHLGCPCVSEDGTKFSSVEEWQNAVLDNPPKYLEPTFRPEVAETIEARIDELNSELRTLSLDIHDHPELGYEERHAHKVLTKFMDSHGFKVTEHYLDLETAWRAEYTNGDGRGHVVGFNSEMDALPGVGHACGHNLIAIVGVAAALGVASAMKKHDIQGKVILLGTPAEEGGQGKVKLIDRGGYKQMDACLMAHPSPGEPKHAGTGPSLAVQALTVEFFGHTAHASASPWEGQNALDAAFLAYSAVSVLRQQIKPTHRVHGIVEGRDWAANIIPDYAKMRWLVRAPSWAEVEILRERVKACFDAAALATACRMEYSSSVGTFDLRQNISLADEFADVAAKRYGMTTLTGIPGAVGGSTDFGNVTYELPSLHPSYAIPTKENGGNHTVLFTEAAATPEAHDITITVAKAIAVTGSRILTDDNFVASVKESFKKGQTTSSQLPSTN